MYAVGGHQSFSYLRFSFVVILQFVLACLWGVSVTVLTMRRVPVAAFGIVINSHVKNTCGSFLHRTHRGVFFLANIIDQEMRELRPVSSNTVDRASTAAPTGKHCLVQNCPDECGVKVAHVFAPERSCDFKKVSDSRYSYRRGLTG